MNAAGSNPQGYDFADEQSFLDDLAALDANPDQVDDHLRAIEDMLNADPIAWSGWLPSNPALRVAVSDSTLHSPVALRITFRVEGVKIVRLGVERRGFTPQP